MPKHELTDEQERFMYHRAYIEEISEFLFNENDGISVDTYGLHDESKFDRNDFGPDRVLFQDFWIDDLYSETRYKYTDNPEGFYHCDSSSVYTNLGRIGDE